MNDETKKETTTSYVNESIHKEDKDEDPSK